MTLAEGSLYWGGRAGAWGARGGVASAEARRVTNRPRLPPATSSPPSCFCMAQWCLPHVVDASTAYNHYKVP